MKVKKPKHIKTEPIKSLITGKRIGTKYIYPKTNNDEKN